MSVSEHETMDECAKDPKLPKMAFPVVIPKGENITVTGLSKRELFAAMAMAGARANSIPGSHHRPDRLAMESVEVADALLTELEKK